MLRKMSMSATAANRSPAEPLQRHGTQKNLPTFFIGYRKVVSGPACLHHPRIEGFPSSPRLPSLQKLLPAPRVSSLTSAAASGGLPYPAGSSPTAEKKARSCFKRKSASASTAPLSLLSPSVVSLTCNVVPYPTDTPVHAARVRRAL
eukprot:763564-Hanusia_phi.AAC.5